MVTTRERKGVVHVRNDSAEGHKVEIAQNKMRAWHDRGYSVGPMPADGRQHVYDKPCPVCAGDVAEELEREAQQARDEEHRANVAYLKGKLIETTPDYWKVLDRQGRHAGDVSGGGPTRDTRYKAINKNDEWMNPDAAPAAGYGTTPEDAGAYLLDTPPSPDF